MAFKFTWRTILPIFIALIFMSSIFVVFANRSIGKGSKVYITVDIGTPDGVYNGMVNAGENATALGVLSSYAGKVQLDNGTVKCILTYCNSNNSVWKVYKVETTSVGPQEVQINETLENYVVKAGEKFIFRFETV